ncbi:hypothetical protein FB440_10112 [Vibrio crassostreae]|nr:hypothetical protein FB440_10112 [Vibrio crassostreae]
MLTDSTVEAYNSERILNFMFVTDCFIGVFHKTVKTNIQTNHLVRSAVRSTYLLNIVNLGVNRFN